MGCTGSWPSIEYRWHRRLKKSAASKNRRSCNSRSPTEHGTMLKKPRRGESVTIAPENDGLSQTAHKDAMGMDLNNQRAPTGGEEKNSRQKKSLIVSSTAELTACTHCNVCNGTATVPATTPESRQNICHNKSSGTTTSFRARGEAKTNQQ